MGSSLFELCLYSDTCHSPSAVDGPREALDFTPTTTLSWVSQWPPRPPAKRQESCCFPLEGAHAFPFLGVSDGVRTETL